MDRDAKLMRQEGPTIFAQARHMKGVPEIADLILKAHKEATGKRWNAADSQKYDGRECLLVPYVSKNNSQNFGLLWNACGKSVFKTSRFHRNHNCIVCIFMRWKCWSIHDYLLYNYKMCTLWYSFWWIQTSHRLLCRRVDCPFLHRQYSCHKGFIEYMNKTRIHRIFILYQQSPIKTCNNNSVN